MIPSVEAVVAAHRFVARRYGLPGAPNLVGIARALDLARELAASPDDEGAAVFFALARFPKALAGPSRVVPTVLAMNLAASRGQRLTLDPDELPRLYTRIAANEVGFEEVRRLFASRLAPR